MGPLQDIRETWARFLNKENPAVAFVDRQRRSILLFSLVLVLPCFWHRRIEAGDLASHVYNAWLAQLIEKGQAPGLYIARQWNNILFDVSLLQVAKIVGFSAAEKIVVPACVLIFFWGVFALISAVSERPPWFLAPCIAMLAYGYSFSMGFMNYYLSLGLACFGLAILWQGRGLAWAGGALLALLALLAHPIGFLWLIGTVAYIRVHEKLPRGWKLAVPLTAAAALFAANRYAAHQPALSADWDRGPFYLYNGADQLALYGPRYIDLAVVAFVFGVLCVVMDRIAARGEGTSWKRFALPLELYAVTFCGIALLPENLRPSIYTGWIGLLGSRLTAVAAILGLCLLGFIRPRRWQLAGFAACGIVFFAFLYQDAGWMNRLEANAEKLVSGLSPGTRVIASADAPAGSRIPFVYHAIERACIGHCFSFGNYEPASGEFRVRVREGSPVVSASTDDAEDMASGDYEVEESVLPIKQIYQCDARDLTKLCIRDLAAGQSAERLDSKPPNRRMASAALAGQLP